jgi:hypothetical protein
MLRSQSVKGAHPDDGWVNRQANELTLAYPQFLDSVKPGDLFALGWCDGHKLVKVKSISHDGGFYQKLLFEEIDIKQTTSPAH